jgi:hypothetical protein
MSRAALYAFGATSITVATACSSGGGTTTGDTDGSADASSDSPGVSMPAYGTDAPDDTGSDMDDAEPDVTAAPLYGATPVEAGVPPDASGDEIGMGMALYGGPGILDSGTKEDGASSDASDRDVIRILPAYGLSP